MPDKRRERGNPRLRAATLRRRHFLPAVFAAGKPPIAWNSSVRAKVKLSRPPKFPPCPPIQ